MPNLCRFQKLNGETMRKRAFYKDIIRTLKNNLSRFIAIVVMTALGTGVFTGFAAGCLNVFTSADRFYDKQNTYDIKIASTLGLTNEDLSAIAGLENVNSVFGNCSMDVMTTSRNGNQLLANVTTLDTDGMNSPYMLEGTLPAKPGQIAVTSKFIKDTGLQIGDTIVLKEATTEDADATEASSKESTDMESENIGTENSGIVNNGTENNSTENNGTENNGTKNNRTENNGTENNGTENSGTVNNETVNYETVNNKTVNDGTKNNKTEDNETEDNDTELEITIDNDSTTPSLAVTEYEITAIVLSPLNINSTEGSITAISFSTSSSDYMMFATKDCINSDIYTAIYITLEGTTGLDCYSDKYQAIVDNMTDTIKETIQEERQQARYNEIVEEANSKITEAEQLLEDKTAEADQKLSDAQAKIDDGWNSYKEGLAEVQKNEIKLTDGQQALKDAQKSASEKFLAGQKEIDDGLAKLNTEEENLNTQEATALEKFASYEQELKRSQEEINIQKSEADVQFNGVVAGLPIKAQEIWNSEAMQKIWSDMVSDGEQAAPYLLAVKQGETPTKDQTDTYNSAMVKLQADTQALAVGFATKGSPLTEEQIKAFSTLAVTYGTLNYSQAKLDDSGAALATQKSDALKQISEGRKQIDNGKTKLINGQKELDKNKAEAKRQFAEKQDELNDGIQKLEDAKQKLSDVFVELTDGQKELDENKSEYGNSIATARQKLSDAKEDVASISMAKWYVWDRSENDSFSGLNNDISFIQAVTQAFPIIFFLVAILISLTTMTRMVEEDRALIGTYKSLGFSKLQISMKYILYAVLACIAGGILGLVIGFLGLPKVIEIIVKTLYVMPTFQFYFYPVYGLGGFGLFLFGIVGATIISCGEMLHKRPSELMRPKPPKEGSRILLERIPFIWKRLNFLNKVTCRNLFRYKKRALMTIIGILGCMMLIVLGFGIRDTVNSLMPDQFETITVYDAIVVTDNLNTDEMDQLDKEWKASGMVRDGLQLQISTLTLWSGSDNLDITVMVVPDSADLKDYVHLNDTATNKKMSLPTNGIVVTQNAAKQLKLKSGDTISLQNEDNLEYDFPVAFVTTNYAGNYIYISESCYQAVFGDYAGTSFLVNLTDQSKGQEWLDQLSEDNRILAVNSSEDARNTFGEVKSRIDMVVYLLISMSAVLALTVLFTLSNINVSERERELATMKVLGFRHKEVYSYVNKETFILTLLGVLLGMPAGYGITYAILANVNIADIAFNVRVSVMAYLTAALLTMIFTLLVNKFTNKTLRKISMVEALKSVE